MKTDCNIQRSVSELVLARLCLSLPSTCSTGIYKFEPVKVSSLLKVFTFRVFLINVPARIFKYPDAFSADSRRATGGRQRVTEIVLFHRDHGPSYLYFHENL